MGDNPLFIEAFIRTHYGLEGLVGILVSDNPLFIEAFIRTDPALSGSVRN